ncbi:DUF4421 family protein [Parabacteroides sp. PF5-9]|uniref:DUF4421 family protein n=1 Tax=Parabacteroides sp. PF5-9 TaxID=1742404 RepID=UPI002477048C|nr:DUF4421 family protein [Parabacteroides sp. PF5-9]
MKLKYLLLFIAFSSCIASAQVDSLFIGSYDQKLMIIGFVAKDFVFLETIQPQSEQTYFPNNPARLGVGLSWKNSVLSFAYGYPFDFLREKKFGKTRFIDWQYHHYDRKFVFDLFLQRYKGFYMEDKKRSEPFILSPDLSVRQYGMNANYIVNNKKFSYKAAFVQNEKQLRSAGSLLLGGGIYVTQITSDSSFVYMDRRSFDNFQFGLSAGYAYTWVLGKRWFINGSCTVGINFGSEKVSSFGKQKLEVYPTVFPRMSIGYNHEKWAMSFVYISNITFPSYTEDHSITLLAGKFQLSYIHRIEDLPFLSKLLDKLPF